MDVSQSVFDLAFVDAVAVPSWYLLQCSRHNDGTAAPSISSAAEGVEQASNLDMQLNRTPTLTVEWRATCTIKKGEECFFEYGDRPGDNEPWETFTQATPQGEGMMTSRMYTEADVWGAFQSKAGRAGVTYLNKGVGGKILGACQGIYEDVTERPCAVGSNADAIWLPAQSGR